MVSYKTLQDRSEQHWQELVSGDRPWIRIGTAMCGHAAGALDTLARLKEEIDSMELDVSLDEVGCLGLCYAEPLVDILKPGKQSRVMFQNVTPDDIPEILRNYLVDDNPHHEKTLGFLGGSGEGGIPNLSEVPGFKLQHRIALRNAGNIAPNDIFQYIANGGFAGLNKALFDMNSEDVIAEVTNSKLRGRGGAGFPTGIKWSFMVRSPGPPKYILCNCEEGDPGAYNDKGILESDPYTLLEGMIIAGYATGASNGFIFIRHGHDGPINRTKHAINQAYETGLLGENILGSNFGFDIEISLTGDSYVAGEETGLMESIEGKRAMPRFKPPFPAAFGVWGKPSTINNVKSLSYPPEIISRGSEWFSSIGPENCTGTAIICLSGDINHPGMYEIPMGIRMRDVIEQIGGGVPNGKSLKIVQLGGPLGHILNESILDCKIDFDSMRDVGAMLGSGGVIVSNEDQCAVDLARVLVAFCQFESCGKCFPCRLGMTHLLDMVENISKFDATASDLDLIGTIGNTMEAGSLCFHGQLGVNPIRSAVEQFPEDFRIHIEEKRCPTGSCDRPITVPRNLRPFGENASRNQIPLKLPSSIPNPS